jgi:phosphopantetheine adenylyltransferase
MQLQAQAVDQIRFGEGLTELEILILFHAMQDWSNRTNITRTQHAKAEQLKEDLAHIHKQRFGG